MLAGRALWWRLTAAFVGGLAGAQLPMAVGPLLGALLAATATNLVGERGTAAPAWLRTTVQVLLGALVGGTLGPIAERPALLGPALVTTAAAVLVWMLGSLLIARVARVDLGTALLVSAPGSPAETTAAAAEAGYPTELVAALQIGRVLAVLLIAALLARL